MSADSQSARRVTNFGGNVRFTPRHVYTPHTEQDVLDILNRHAEGKVRVVALRHSWSEAIVSDDALVDLRHFDRVQVTTDGDTGEVRATVGGGTKIKHLLRELHRLSDTTMPTLGAITEQTIAGAISTGTHGSGRHSISHYIDQIRVAAYDPESGRAKIYTWTDGPDLRAARCGLGCLGVILSVRFRCVPKYYVVETIRRHESLEDVLAAEEEFPLQQFVLVPHLWSYYAMHRRVASEPSEQRRTWHAPLYRAYALLGIDVAFHLIVKLLVLLRSSRLTRFFYRRVFPLIIWFKNRKVIDHSHKALILEHELFRHLEMELFVPARHIVSAVEFIRHVLSVFAGTSDVPDEMAKRLDEIGMLDALREQRGTFTFHYPLFFRRVLPDDTLISMASGEATSEPYYTISFFTYAQPRAPFYALAGLLAQSVSQLYSARPHWGKYFPLSGEDVQRLYSQLESFREVCGQVDPKGVFRNEYVTRVLGFDE